MSNVNILSDAMGADEGGESRHVVEGHVGEWMVLFTRASAGGVIVFRLDKPEAFPWSWLPQGSHG